MKQHMRQHLKQLRLVLVVPLLMIAAAGCADGQSSSDASGSSPSLSASPLESATPAPSGTGMSGSVPPGVADSPEIQAAVADLATRLDVSPSEVQVLSVQEVIWSDGSLGCPKPGMNYTQQLIDGQLVVLSAKDTTYEYHSGGSRPLFLCTNPKAPARVS